MVSRINFRVILVGVVLLAGAAREVAREPRPSILRPGLRMYAYVANTADGTVTAVDLVNLAARGTIPVGPLPSGLRAHPTRDEVWGVSTRGGYAWVLETKAGGVTARVPVREGAYALDFSPDGQRAYVAASGAGVVTVIDCATRRVVRVAAAGKRPWLARVTPNGRIVVVPNRDDGTVTLFDAQLTPLATVPVASQPEQVVILPDSSKAFVWAYGSGELSVVDLQKRVLLANLPLGAGAADLVLKPDGGELFISLPESHGLTIVNTWTNEVAENLLLGDAPSRGILTSDAEWLYVSDPATGQVRPVELGLRRVLQPIPAGQHPGALQFSPGGDLLLVVNEESDNLAVIRPRTQSLLTLIPTGHHPRDLAVKVF